MGYYRRRMLMNQRICMPWVEPSGAEMGRGGGWEILRFYEEGCRANNRRLFKLRWSAQQSFRLPVQLLPAVVEQLQNVPSPHVPQAVRFVCECVLRKLRAFFAHRYTNQRTKVCRNCILSVCKCANASVGACVHCARHRLSQCRHGHVDASACACGPAYTRILYCVS